MSSGVCSLPSGVCLATASSNSCRCVFPSGFGVIAPRAVMRSHIGVHSSPGQIAFTLMLCRASANACDCVRLIAPALDTLYGGLRSEPCRPAIDAMLIILPDPRSRICGVSASLTRAIPFTFTS